MRKAAVKVIFAVVQARPDRLAETYAVCGPQLVRRFKEREENVRLDVLACFTAIVQASHGGNNGAGNGAGGTTTPLAQLITSVPSSGMLECCLCDTGKARTSLPQLEAPKTLQSIFAACSAQLAGTSPKAKSAVFQLLRSLVLALDVRASLLVPPCCL